MIINQEFILSCKKVRLSRCLKNQPKFWLMSQSYSKSLIFNATNTAISIVNATDTAIDIATAATFQNK